MEETQLIKSPAAAKQIGISVQTLKNHWSQGLIEAVTIKGRRYYTPEAIQEYINTHRDKK